MVFRDDRHQLSGILTGGTACRSPRANATTAQASREVTRRRPRSPDIRKRGNRVSDVLDDDTVAHGGRPVQRGVPGASAPAGQGRCHRRDVSGKLRLRRLYLCKLDASTAQGGRTSTVVIENRASGHVLLAGAERPGLSSSVGKLHDVLLPYRPRAVATSAVHVRWANDAASARLELGAGAGRCGRAASSGTKLTRALLGSKANVRILYAPGRLKSCKSFNSGRSAFVHPAMPLWI